MAAARRKSVKKLTGTIIRAISLAKKALLEEDIVERVCRQARGTFSVYFESSLAGEVDTKHCNDTGATPGMNRNVTNQFPILCSDRHPQTSIN